jgi:hypothetical protein
MPTIVGYNINLGKVRTLTRIVEPKQIVFYADEDGNEPFQVWLDELRDTQGRRSRVGKCPQISLNVAITSACSLDIIDILDF